MKVKVNGSEPFKTIQNCFQVGYTTEGYTLEYSTDKENWTAYPDAIPASENLVVNDCVPYSWFRLNGNEDEVDVIL